MVSPNGVLLVTHFQLVVPLEMKSFTAIGPSRTIRTPSTSFTGKQNEQERKVFKQLNHVIFQFRHQTWNLQGALRIGQPDHVMGTWWVLVSSKLKLDQFNSKLQKIFLTEFILVLEVQQDHHSQGWVRLHSVTVTISEFEENIENSPFTVAIILFSLGILLELTKIWWTRRTKKL